MNAVPVNMARVRVVWIATCQDLWGITSCCEEICRVNAEGIFMSTFIATEETFVKIIPCGEVPAFFFTCSSPFIETFDVDPFHCSPKSAHKEYGCTGIGKAR